MRLKKVFTGLLCACMLMGCTGKNGNDVEETVTLPNIPYGEDISSYHPEEDGYYGILNVRKEDTQKEFVYQSLGVLVYQDTVYAKAEETAAYLNLNTIYTEDGAVIYAPSTYRRLHLHKNSSKAAFELGTDNGTYTSKNFRLSAPVLEYGEEGDYWVPLYDLMQLFDLEFYPFYDTETEILGLTVYESEESVMDVLTQLYLMGDQLQTSYDSEHTFALLGSAATVKYTGGLLTFDAATLKSFLRACVGDQDYADSIWDDMLQEVLQDIYMTTVDQSVHDRYEEGSDWRGLATEAAEVYADHNLDIAHVDFAAAKEALNANMPVLPVLAEPTKTALAVPEDFKAWEAYKKASYKLNSASKLQKFLKSDILQAADVSFDAFLSCVESYEIYDSIETMTRNSLQNLVNDFGKRIKTDLYDSAEEYMKKELDRLNGSRDDYALSRYWRDHLTDALVKTPVLEVCPLFILYSLYTYLPPQSTYINAADSFLQSMMSMALEPIAYDMFKKYMDEYDLSDCTSEEMKKVMEAAYLYLKTCYVSKQLVKSAIPDLPAEDLKRTNDLNELILNKAAVLSTGYAEEEGLLPANLTAQCSVNKDHAVLLLSCVRPLYTEVEGTVLSKEDELPVPDAECVLTFNNETCGTFKGTDEEGNYHVYIPFCIPDTFDDYGAMQEVSVSLYFTSETVEGDDTVTVKDHYGLTIDNPETAYIGVNTVTFAQASPLTVFDGQLYTSRDPIGADIITCPAPVEYSYIRKMAYYDGRIYYSDYTGGTDMEDPGAVKSCKTDGSDVKIIGARGDTAWRAAHHGFAIQNDYLVYQSYNPSTGSFLSAYDLKNNCPAEFSEIADQVPVAKLAADNPKSVILQEEDDSYTFYVLLRNAEVYKGSFTEDSIPANLENAHSSFLAGVRGAENLFCVHDGYLYLSRYDGATSRGVLLRMNTTTGESEEVDSHYAAGGGDAYYND